MGRDIGLDRARGIAILLVVAGHAIQFNDPAYASVSLYSLIYSFHMPLFFILSRMLKKAPE